MYCQQCGTEHKVLPPVCTCGFSIATPAAPPVVQFHTEAEGGALLPLYLKTLLLSIVTLGIYSFWGRAEIRRYLYSETFVGDDRLRNHVTGLELFLGWLKALCFLVVFYTVFIGLSLSDPKNGPVIGMVFFYIVLFALIPFVIVASSRYRMSRTSLRGIHFSSTAQYGEFAWLYYKGLLLTLVTLGFYSPWFTTEVTGYLTRHTRYGDRYFAFDGEGKHLLKPYVIWLVLLIPTLYLISFWYFARQHNYLWERTTFGGARFRSSFRGRDLLGLMVTNALLVIFTLGIALPWTTLRTLRYYLDTLWMEGDAGLDDVHQRVVSATATGEGAASLLDMDVDAGGGLGI